MRRGFLVIRRGRPGGRPQTWGSAPRGFTLIELLIAVAIILIIIMVAIPNLQHAQQAAHETAAIGAIRTLNTAEVQYSSEYGRFAKSLAELGPPENGARSAAADGAIGEDLASGIKSGYKFTLSGDGDSYEIHAEPVSWNNTGSHTYYSDQTLAIRVNNGKEPATSNSPVYGKGK